MARPKKQGLDYFPFDVDFFSNVKIRKISRACGPQSTSILICLLCNIYMENGYYISWDEDLPFVIADSVGVSEGAVKEVVIKAIQVGFFNKDMFDKHSILTSESIQRRFKLATYQRKEIIVNRDFLVSCANNSVSCANNSVNHVNNQQSKVNRKKIKESSTNVEEKKTSSPPSPPASVYSFPIDEEIEKLRMDECWLDQLQVLHSITKNELRDCMEDFRIQCLADGKEFHQSLQDAKQHFNSWLRIVKNNKKNNNDKDKSNRRNLRKGNVLKADEEKTYGDSF